MDNLSSLKRWNLSFIEMFLKTIQATSFRNIFEVLKDIINAF
jgi:hypothetical protein